MLWNMIKIVHIVMEKEKYQEKNLMILENLRWILLNKRFEIKYGKFGAYFFDNIKKEPLALEDIEKIMNEISLDKIEIIAKWIYEATRIEAKWSERRIVPEQWEDRGQAFREQFIRVLKKYFEEELPTPEEAHDSWMDAYIKMGWKYGAMRDPVRRTHPDMVPFDDLPKDERDKDAIFLSFVFLAKKLKEDLS